MFLNYSYGYTLGVNENDTIYNCANINGTVYGDLIVGNDVNNALYVITHEITFRALGDRILFQEEEGMI